MRYKRPTLSKKHRRQIKTIDFYRMLPKLATYLLRAMGLSFIVVGSLLLFMSIQLSLNSRETEGTVIDFTSGRTKSPIVAYTVDAIKYTINDGIGSTTPAYRIGQKLSVIYPPNNPRQARLNSSSLFSIPCIAIMAGLLVFVISFFVHLQVPRSSGRRTA